MIVVVDTGALLALLDRTDRHHDALRAEFEGNRDRWILPWAILPEVDYLIAAELGSTVQHAFLQDLAEGLYHVDFGDPGDLSMAFAFNKRYHSLKLGLVDGCVLAAAERLRATAIATLDLRHFAAVSIKGAPKLLPRDL